MSKKKENKQRKAYRSLRDVDEITTEEYLEWRDSLPESPVPEGIRMAVRGAYALQRMRVANGNRLYAQLRRTLGIHPNEPESESDFDASETKEGKKILADAKAEYERITEGASEMLTARKFERKGSGVFSTYAEYVLCGQFMNCLAQEEDAFKRLEDLIKDIPVYKEFLSKVPGVGPAGAAFLLAELNPYRAPYPSSFWAYLGLGVGPDGVGDAKTKRRRVWMLRGSGDDKHVEAVMGCGYNPRKKSRVVEGISKSMIRVGVRWRDVDDETWEAADEDHRRVVKGKKDEPGRKQVIDYERMPTYVRMYFNYKNRKKHSREFTVVLRKGADGHLHGKKVRWCDTTPSHRDRASRRYMIKMFLIDFHREWRRLEGLPETKPYSEAKLGIRHHEDS